jgi:phenylacetate-CoA ligase
MIERVLGRTDDMVKVKGVNIFPGQVDNVLHLTPGAGSEYQLILSRDQGKDRLLVKMEYLPGFNGPEVAAACRHQIKSRIGILADVEALPLGTLPRNEKKTRRVYDYRD